MKKVLEKLILSGWVISTVVISFALCFAVIAVAIRTIQWIW